MLRIINAKIGDSYSYSSTQINFPKSIAKEIVDWGKKNIPDDDLYEDEGDRSFGRENDIHVTVKYGLHTADAKEVEKLISDFGSFEIKLGEISRFVPSEEEYQVIKIDIESEKLKELNKLIADNLKNSDSHPVYKPHCTIAYVKKGTHSDLSGNRFFVGKKFKTTELCFSSKNGTKNISLS